MISPDGDEVTGAALDSAGEDWWGIVAMTAGNGCMTLGSAVGVVTIGPVVDGVRVGPAVGVVTIGPVVGVMSTLQAVPVVAVVEVIVPSHSICDAAVGIGKLKESPVDQKLARRAKPVKSASIATATSARATA